MEQPYDNKMSQLGYNHLICDIFKNWEDVKDEILVPERKEGEVMELYTSSLELLTKNYKKNLVPTMQLLIMN